MLMVDTALSYLAKIPPTEMIFILLLMSVLLVFTSSFYRRQRPNTNDLLIIAAIPMTVYSFITIAALSLDFDETSNEYVIPIYWALGVHIYMCLNQLITVHSKKEKTD